MQTLKKSAFINKIRENQGDYDPWQDYIPPEDMSKNTSVPAAFSQKNAKLLKKIVKSASINKENIPHYNNLNETTKEKNKLYDSVEFDDFDEFPEKKLNDTSPNIFFEISPQTMIINNENDIVIKEGKENEEFITENLCFVKPKEISNITNRENDNNMKIIKENLQFLSPKEINGCLFTPKTTGSRSNDKRTLNQFLESQATFKKNQEKKIKQLKENLELSYQQEYTFQPSICLKSKKIVISKSSNNLAAEPNQNPSKTTNNNNSQKKRLNTSISKRNSQLLDMKFKKSFNKLLQELTIDSEKMTYNQLLAFLVSFGVLPETSANNKAYIVKLIDDIWTLLKGDLYEGIHTTNLYIFLIIVLRLPIHSVIKPSNIPISMTSFNEQGIWLISSEEDIHHLQKKFEILYINKLSYDNNAAKAKKTPMKNKQKPSISPISKMLALHHREKLLNEVLYLMHNNEKVEGLELKISENKILNNIDLLVVQNKIQKLHHKYLQEEKIKKETNQCTFNPELNTKKTVNKRPRIYSVTYGNYNKYKKDKDPVEIEYEKHKKDCTFKPEISRKNGRNTMCKGVSVKNEQKSIERMRAARVEKEFLESCRQRGAHSSHISREKISGLYNNNAYNVFPSPSNICSNKNIEENSNQEDKIPLLFVDVNLGSNKNERIVIFEGDKSDDLAKEFCNFHGLDVETKNRLKDLLDEQISGVLTRISEEHPLSEDENLLDLYNN